MMLVFLTAVMLSLAFRLAGWCFSERGEESSKLTVYLMFTAAALLAAVTTRWLQTYHPANMTEAAVLKSCASLSPVLLGVRGFRLHPNRYGGMLLASMILCGGADVSINYNFSIGGALFGLAHLIFLIAFFREQKPNRPQILAWLAGTAAAVIIMYIMRAYIPGTGFMKVVLASLYLSVLLSTVVLSLRLSKITFFAAAVFACSDLMLIANIATGGTVLTRLIALLVYYASLILYATVIWKNAEADS